MAVQFINVEQNLVATMSDERDVNYVITDRSSGAVVRVIPIVGSTECIAATKEWKIVKTEEAREYWFNTLANNASSKDTFLKGCQRMWDNGIDAPKFTVEGNVVTDVATGLTFECSQPKRFVEIAERSTFTYAQYRWNRAEVLSKWGVKKVAEGVCEFSTTKKGDGSKVRVVMQALELNMGMYSQMLKHDIEKLLAWDLSTETELVKEAYAELLASNMKSLDGAKYDASRLFLNTICGIVLEEETLSPAQFAKKVYNKSSKTQAKEYIQKKLGLACAKLRSYVLN